jgi:hypothetical protein
MLGLNKNIGRHKARKSNKAPVQTPSHFGLIIVCDIKQMIRPGKVDASPVPYQHLGRILQGLGLRPENSHQELYRVYILRLCHLLSSLFED